MIKGARFRYQASLEELSYDPSRGLNKSIISDLATCGYIARGESVLITGATGCGKSFLASALGIRLACMVTTLFTLTPKSLCSALKWQGRTEVF